MQKTLYDESSKGSEIAICCICDMLYLLKEEIQKMKIWKIIFLR